MKYLSFHFIFFTFSITRFLLKVVWRYYPTGRVIPPICTFQEMSPSALQNDTTAFRDHKLIVDSTTIQFHLSVATLEKVGMNQSRSPLVWRSYPHLPYFAF